MDLEHILGFEMAPGGAVVVLAGGGGEGSGGGPVISGGRIVWLDIPINATPGRDSFLKMVNIFSPLPSTLPTVLHPSY